jgi:transglutaminase-like putative cysteine protease
MTNLTREMVMLLIDGREYRVAYAMGNGEWDVVDRFMAVDDNAANAYAEAYFYGDEWYVLDDTGRNINGGRDQA